MSSRFCSRGVRFGGLAWFRDIAGVVLSAAKPFQEISTQHVGQKAADARFALALISQRLSANEFIGGDVDFHRSGFVKIRIPKNVLKSI
jgi:hypothetical protein